MVGEKDVMFHVRIGSSLKAAIDNAATEQNLTSSDWVRAVLARAVDKGAFGNWKVAAPPKRGDRHGSKPKRKPAE